MRQTLPNHFNYHLAVARESIACAPISPCAESHALAIVDRLEVREVAGEYRSGETLLRMLEDLEAIVTFPDINFHYMS